MGKAFDEKTNQILRVLARHVLKKEFGGVQSRLASKLGVTAGFLSDFLSEKRGAGLDMLVGLGRYAPLEFLGILGISPGVVVTLIEGKHEELEAGLVNVPDVVRRAARAAIELEGCTPGAACEAALACWEEWGAVPETDADWWLGKIRKRISETGKSGERPSSKLKSAKRLRG